MNLDEKHSKLILSAAEKNWMSNEQAFKQLGEQSLQSLYMQAYLQGYDACYGIFGPIEGGGDVDASTDNGGLPS